VISRPCGGTPSDRLTSRLNSSRLLFQVTGVDQRAHR
jgi:hypothetical protein